jgi:uracil-DNA glycosylase
MVSRKRPDSLPLLADDISGCRACPRLVSWREQVAVEKRASYREDVYWGRGVPGFGDPLASMLVLGLAPAAHGANRTGRVFTGDRSGDWLYLALHRAGVANQPTSRDLDDGLTLHGAWVCAAVRCAPPGNKPEPAERQACLPFLQREVRLLSGLRAILVLGQFAYDVARRDLGAEGSRVPKFGHGVEASLTLFDGRTVAVVCSYHPSQQNTFTGTLTEPMFDAAVQRAVALSVRT